MAAYLTRHGAMALLLIAATACTGNDNSMGMEDKGGDGSLAQFPSVGDQADASVAPAAIETASAPLAPGGEIGRIYFAPVVGAPVDKVTAFSDHLGDAARANSIKLVASDAPDTTHVLKGYFSAFPNNGNTTIVHVWDVISPSGQRIHRFTGQQTVPGTSADAWQSVPASTMATIADEVLADYAAWQGRSS